MRKFRPFRYWFDPICLLSVAMYAINRWYLKPHHIGGLFTVGYLNDVLCLPLFLPIILGLQRTLRIRQHDGYPRLWEMLQNWVIFSLLFEVILPCFPQYFRTTADPLDVLAYLAGGTLAWVWWSVHARPRATSGLASTFRPARDSAVPLESMSWRAGAICTDARARETR